MVNFIHFGRLICDKNVEELENEKSEPKKMAATERLKMQLMERKTKAPNGQPKKSSVFSNRGSHFSKRFSNECETYKKVHLPHLKWISCNGGRSTRNLYLFLLS